MNLIEIASNTLRIEAESILKLIDKLNGNFLKAVDVLYSCKGKVVITGMGKSGLIGKKIAATLSSTGTPSLFLHPAEGVHGDLGMLRKGDCLIAISNSGETDEIVSILNTVKRFDIKIISIVGRLNSTLALKSDCVLDASVDREACPLNLAPTASTTATLALGDALAVALLEKRGFREEDFAMFHPSGSLGKKLLVKVHDLFHTGERLPVVNQECSVADTVLVMSSKGFGCAAVVDDNGILKGIITDGDLRRGIQKYESVFDKKVSEIYNPSPKLISEESLAAEALQLMEEKSITVLLVIDNENKPYGIIHLHDILKAGIV